MKNIINDSDFIDMDLGFAYRFLDPPGLLVPHHAHNFYEYFFIKSGAVIHIVNGKQEKLSVGDLVFIRQNDFHGYKLINKCDCEVINVSFTSEIFESICAFLGSNTQKIFLSSELSQVTPTNEECPT